MIKPPAGSQGAEGSQPSLRSATVHVQRIWSAKASESKRRTAGLIRPRREEGAEALIAAGLQPRAGYPYIHIRLSSAQSSLPPDSFCTSEYTVWLKLIRHKFQGLGIRERKS